MPVMAERTALLDEPRASAGRRRRVRGLVAAGVVLGVLIVAAVGLARWWTHPTHFTDAGDGLAAEPRPVADAAVHMAVALPPIDGDEVVVTLRRLEAHFSAGSAAAPAAFSVCRLGDRIPPGYVRGELSAHCAEVVPVEEGTVFRHGPDSGEVLVMTVTPSAPGLSHVDSVTIDYELDRSRFWRRGAQTIAVDLLVAAT